MKGVTKFEAMALFNHECEQSVLGGLLLDNRSFYRLPEVGITEDDFHHPAHRMIWRAVLALISANRPADVVTVAAQLGRDAEQVGGLAYLNSLAQSVPSAAHIAGYARTVVELAQRRALLMAGAEVKVIAQQDGRFSELADKAMGTLLALQRDLGGQHCVLLRESIIGQTEQWERIGRGEVTPGMKTRLSWLDGSLGGGLQRGRVVVLAARPSVGKTSLAVQLGLNVAEGRHRVLMLSQEMPVGDLTDRITANLGHIPLDAFASGLVDESDYWARIVEVQEREVVSHFRIDDQPGVSLLAIRAKAQAAKYQHGLDLLVIDYLQLCSASNSRASRHHQIEEISRGLKVLAKELDICILVLSQINRDVTRADREPTLADLKESGAIEEDADVVLMLHPRGDLRDGAKLVACIVSKNRQGRTGRMALRFSGEFQRWDECEADVSQPQVARVGGRSFDNGL